jgi:YegS/Rv2252/BmrU family lipid kinase
MIKYTLGDHVKHFILANPYSGRKNGKKIAIAVRKLLLKNNINAKIIMSEYPTHLTKVTKDLSSKSACRFYVIGGDGTLNEAISGIINTNSDIVIIPGGTGNDFIKSVSKYKSMRKIVLSSLNKESTPVDILKVNRDKYCLNILNAGFDALVAENVNLFRGVPFISGKMKYNLAIFYTLLTNRNYKFKIRTDKNIQKNNFTLIAVANGKYYGGGIIPCPDAITDDGYMDICAIDATRVSQKLFFLPSYSKGKHINNPKVHFSKDKKIHIVSNKKFPVSIDGEVFLTNKLNISVLEKCVKIVTF